MSRSFKRKTPPGQPGHEDEEVHFCASRAAAQHDGSRPRQLRLEALEDRQLLAAVIGPLMTLTVRST